MDREVVHLSQAEAIRDIAAILERVERGAEVIVERDQRPMVVIQPNATYFSTTAQSQLCGAGPLTRGRPPGRPFCGGPGSPPGGGLAVQGDRPTKSKWHWVIQPAPRPGRLLSECIALAEAHGSTVTLDEDFAQDLEEIINSRREPLDGSPGD